jgi:hypothetical protein
MMFQYSKGVNFCQSIAGKSTNEVFEVIKAIALTYPPVDYGAYYLSNATFAMYTFLNSARMEEELEHGSIKVAHSSAISRLQVTIL